MHVHLAARRGEAHGEELVAVADEPTGAPDKENAAQVVSMLSHFSNNGATVLVATHNANVADACDDVPDLGATRAS